MKINFRQIDRFQMSVVAIIWVVSSALTLGAVNSIVHAIQVRAKATAEGSVGVARIKQLDAPASAEEVSAILDRLRPIHPGVKFEATAGGNVRLSILEEGSYSEWHAAIADLMQAGGNDMIFETLSICGAGCGGTYCSAEFAPKKMRYAVE